jgi:hypothetical protein
MLTKIQFFKEIEQIERKKIERQEYDEFLVSNSNKIIDMEIIIEKHDNEIKSLENFVEKYVPCIT